MEGGTQWVLSKRSLSSGPGESKGGIALQTSTCRTHTADVSRSPKSPVSARFFHKRGSWAHSGRHSSREYGGLASTLRARWVQRGTGCDGSCIEELRSIQGEQLKGRERRGRGPGTLEPPGLGQGPGLQAAAAAHTADPMPPLCTALQQRRGAPWT